MGQCSGIHPEALLDSWRGNHAGLSYDQGEGRVFIVGFSAADDPGLTLEFQLSDRVDGQDALLEMDTYSISNASAPAG
jgi:hypothetical protein